jgi:hypothetical protein
LHDAAFKAAQETLLAVENALKEENPDNLEVICKAQAAMTSSEKVYNLYKKDGSHESLIKDFSAVEKVFNSAQAAVERKKDVLRITKEKLTVEEEQAKDAQNAVKATEKLKTSFHVDNALKELKSTFETAQNNVQVRQELLAIDEGKLQHARDILSKNSRVLDAAKEKIKSSELNNASFEAASAALHAIQDAFQGESSGKGRVAEESVAAEVVTSNPFNDLGVELENSGKKKRKGVFSESSIAAASSPKKKPASSSGELSPLEKKEKEKFLMLIKVLMK